MNMDANLNINMHSFVRIEFQCLCYLAAHVFPSAFSNAICEEAWGDYGDSRNFIMSTPRPWSAEVVMEHRSVIMFVDAHTFKYCIPEFVKASLTQGGVNYDVLEYLVNATHARYHDIQASVSDTERITFSLIFAFLSRVLLCDADTNSDLVDKTRALARAFLDGTTSV